MMDGNSFFAKFSFAVIIFQKLLSMLKLWWLNRNLKVLSVIMALTKLLIEWINTVILGGVLY